MNNKLTFNILWSQIDANQHLRHSAYADFGAQARFQVLQDLGFDMETFKKIKIGPILFREEMIYLREVLPNDQVEVSTELVKCRKDASRWSIKHEIVRSDGVKAAQINVDGAWLDLAKRKLAALPETLAENFLKLPKADEFEFSE